MTSDTRTLGAAKMSRLCIRQAEFVCSDCTSGFHGGHEVYDISKGRRMSAFADRTQAG